LNGLLPNACSELFWACHLFPLVPIPHKTLWFGFAPPPAAFFAAETSIFPTPAVAPHRCEAKPFPRGISRPPFNPARPVFFPSRLRFNGARFRIFGIARGPLFFFENQAAPISKPFFPPPRKDDFFSPLTMFIPSSAKIYATKFDATENCKSRVRGTILFLQPASDRNTKEAFSA